MRRREFIWALGGAAAALPVAARAQQQAMPVIGFLNSISPEGFRRPLAGFVRGLGEEGYVEGRNVRIEYRWARGEYERLPGLAADLVSRQVNVIAATGGTVAALAAKNASPTIPIVFELGRDPVEAGLVSSLNRPGGNITGISFLTVPLAQKRMELLVELVPTATTIAMLVNPGSPVTQVEVAEARTAAGLLNRKLVVLTAQEDRGLDSAFETLAGERAGALVVQPEPYFFTRTDLIVALAARNGVAAIYGFREYVTAGGLISYGADIVDVFRHVGLYVGRILKGAKPGDLPIEQPTKFELVINLKTAKALGLTVPPSLLALADEVIE